jgi:hypothetical protein
MLRPITVASVLGLALYTAGEGPERMLLSVFDNRR